MLILCTILQTISTVMQPEAAHAIRGWLKDADEEGVMNIL